MNIVSVDVITFGSSVKLFAHFVSISSVTVAVVVSWQDTYLARTVDWPVSTPVARPFEPGVSLIDSTEGLDEDQVANPVRSFVVLSV